MFFEKIKIRKKWENLLVLDSNSILSFGIFTSLWNSHCVGSSSWISPKKWEISLKIISHLAIYFVMRHFVRFICHISIVLRFLKKCQKNTIDQNFKEGIRDNNYHFFYCKNSLAFTLKFIALKKVYHIHNEKTTTDGFIISHQ